ncbi:cytochrome P450 [Fodinicola feengrottensis]|nr:cytochrome P450 [Fodinicola feengrottensis]
MNLLGTGLFLLLTHPEQWAALRADRSLVPAAVEEMLRYEAPLRTAFPRYAREGVQIGDVTIPVGAVVMIALQSANHDERRYVSNDDFDLARTSATHLAFGHGIHFCVGAPLARLEGRIAFNALLDRYESISLAVPPEDLRWRFSTLIRGLESLPVIGTEAVSRQRQ